MAMSVSAVRPPWWMSGLGLRWSSATKVIVEVGRALDSTNLYEIINAVERNAEFWRALTGTNSTGGVPSTTVAGSGTAYLTEVTPGQMFGNYTVGFARVASVEANNSMTLETALTITAGTALSVSDLDIKQIAGTVATNSTNTTVTGTNTAFLTAFAPGGAPRTLTGTIGTGGVGSVTVTGVGTKFLSELSIHSDMIGNATVGYRRIVGITSDTSLTVVSNITITNGSTGYALENVLFRAAAQTARYIDTITSDTNLTLHTNSSATQSGILGFIGDRSSDIWMYHGVWLISNGATVRTVLSSQRTSFLSPHTGFTVKRRVGSVTSDNSTGGLSPFSQLRAGDARICMFMSQSMSLISGGTASSWTVLDGCQYAPPWAESLVLGGRWGYAVSGGGTCQIRARNSGAGLTVFSTYNNCNTGQDVIELPVNAALRQIEYYITATGYQVDIWVRGYRESVRS